MKAVNRRTIAACAAAVMLLGSAAPANAVDLVGQLHRDPLPVAELYCTDSGLPETDKVVEIHLPADKLMPAKAPRWEQ